MACFFLPCHTKLVPWTDFGKEVAKTGPPDQFWLSKSIPLAKNIPPRGQNLANIYVCLLKSVPMQNREFIPMQRMHAR